MVGLTLIWKKKTNKRLIRSSNNQNLNKLMDIRLGNVTNAPSVKIHLIQIFVKYVRTRHLTIKSFTLMESNRKLNLLRQKKRLVFLKQKNLMLRKKKRDLKT